MSNTLLPHMILSKLEDGKRNNLLHELRELTERGNMLEAELETSTLRYKELEKRRYRSSKHRILASDLAVLEEARQEEASLMNSISEQLLKLIEEEKKMDAHIEQQSIDDLMAHRCTQRR